MSDIVYSVHEAKAHFSELLRKVQRAQRVIITHHGKAIAEIIPHKDDHLDYESRLHHLEDLGVVTKAPTEKRTLRTIAAKPKALKQFLADRNE